MTELCEVKAIVRNEYVPELVDALEKAGVTRFFVSRIHALGAGVDPEDQKLSLDDGHAYTEKAKVEFLCGTEAAGKIVDVVRELACTGHRGDGVVVVSEVKEVVSVRTGDCDGVALL